MSPVLFNAIIILGFVALWFICWPQEIIETLKFECYTKFDYFFSCFVWLYMLCGVFLLTSYLILP